MSHSRLDDMPGPLRWGLVAIKEVGFHVVICVWLMYQQFIGGKETLKTLNEFKDVMVQVQATLKEQNKILRRQGGRTLSRSVGTINQDE